MDDRTCIIDGCDTPLYRKTERGRWPKYCETHRVAKKSSYASDSKSENCIRGGCMRPVRAKGLCSTHYNREYHPDRHAWKLKPCVNCGLEVMKSTGGGRRFGATCSNECRDALNGAKAPRSKLPAEHPAIWIGTSSAWPRYGLADCLRCGDKFSMRSPNGAYCTVACYFRHKVGTVYSEQEVAALVRSCDRCGESYSHHRTQRIHCSDECRNLAAIDRGADLPRVWISRARRIAIYERDNYTCWLCDETVEMPVDASYNPWAPSLDHVIPRSKGGTHDESNLRTAHCWCNSIRSDSGVESIYDVAA